MVRHLNYYIYLHAKKDNSVTSISFIYFFHLNVCEHLYTFLWHMYIQLHIKILHLLYLKKNVTYKRTERYCYIIINIDGFIGNAIVIEIYIINL